MKVIDSSSIRDCLYDCVDEINVSLGICIDAEIRANNAKRVSDDLIGMRRTNRMSRLNEAIEAYEMRRRNEDEIRMMRETKQADEEYEAYKAEQEDEEYDYDYI